MRRARSCRWWCSVLSAALSLAWIPSADALLLTLSPQDRAEAIAAGRRSVIDEGWGREWRVEAGAGQHLAVMSPFHQLALAARNSAFQDRELGAREVESVLKDREGKLVFWATLRGGRVDFARFYAPALVSRNQELKASFFQNERTARRGEDGRYTARCLYVFPGEGVDPRGTVTLLVRNAEEKVVAKFTVDLSAMR